MTDEELKAGQFVINHDGDIVPLWWLADTHPMEFEYLYNDRILFVGTPFGKALECYYNAIKDKHSRNIYELIEKDEEKCHNS